MVPLLVASTVLSTVGALSSANAESNAAEYNASVEDLQAKQANDQGAYAAGQTARATRLKLADQRAGAAQSGAEFSGSTVDIMKETAQQGDLDYLTSIYNGDVKATGLRDDADLDRQKASAARTAGYFKAGSSILNGATSFYTHKGNNVGKGMD